MINFEQPTVDLIREVHNKFIVAGIDYRYTGLTAANAYGFGISTNVLDIAVDSEDTVYHAKEVLELEKPKWNTYDPYVYEHDYKDGYFFYVRIQGDILGECHYHPKLGILLHNKELLLPRLSIYANHCGRTMKAAAYIALTIDADKIEKYKEYWNHL